MSLPNRSMPSNLRQPGAPGGQPSGLITRINEKRNELDNLKQLRDLSAGLASQMQSLEEKLATLTNGTEAVATVLSNWHNVLRAIQMASTKIPRADGEKVRDEDGEIADETEVPLPQTLVRIPAEEQPDRSQQTSGGDGI